MKHEPTIATVLACTQPQMGAIPADMLLNERLGGAACSSIVLGRGGIVLIALPQTFMASTGAALLTANTVMKRWHASHARIPPPRDCRTGMASARRERGEAFQAGIGYDSATFSNPYGRLREKPV
ncbi:hypothetical protein [Aliiroseovarius sediminilitoris]|uniref:hypothetical protein n=1 Tax=Aliiroseovarius sediminilitoris TaxID=1173584 RepID=UPI000B8A0CA3|nr:hypothetical protein [Aliiroseovarius sediminilitoris]